MSTGRIRSTEAFAWSCDDCHDTGLAPNALAAERALNEHREEYH